MKDFLLEQPIFLTTSGISYWIERIIIKAERKVYLVSPYIHFSERLKQLISVSKNIEFILIYGKDEFQKGVEEIRGFENVKVYFCKNLHAKCYLNEKLLLVTSMNLLDFSQINNIEFGILMNSNKNNDEYIEAVEEIGRILKSSKEVSKDNTAMKKDKAQLIPLDEWVDLNKISFEKGELSLLEEGFLERGKDGHLYLSKKAKEKRFKVVKKNNEWVFLIPCDFNLENK